MQNNNSDNDNSLPTTTITTTITTTTTTDISRQSQRNSSPLSFGSWQWNPSLLFQNLPSFSNPFRRRGSRTPDEKDSRTREKSLAKFLNGTIVPTAKPKELIELANFGMVEIDDRECGVGHEFKPFHLQNPTWCDSCGEFIWTPVVCEQRASSSNFGQYLQCNNCKYTCHFRCRSLVRIDCQGITETPYVVKQLERPPSPLFFDNSISTLKYKIEKYNEKRKAKGSGLGITLIDDSAQLFRGFLRVHLNLTRPINVIAGRRPPSIYDIINEDEQNSIKRRTLTSFYMPRDTVKNIHITSENTSLDVIKAMLKKFKVVDNPQKFALYLKSTDKSTKSNVLKRILDQEKPLRIQLECDDDDHGDDKQIVLQENDTGDIAWDAFELPELKNFLKILDLEEQEHLSHVIFKYNMIREAINKIIQTESTLNN